jgi:hypothetical protein
MAISSFRDKAGRIIVRVGDRPTRPQRPAPLPPVDQSDNDPIVVIENGGGVQALVLRFAASDKASFARLALMPALEKSGTKAVAARKRIVTHVAKSLRRGGTGAEPMELEWSLKDELSLNDIADRLSIEINKPVTIEIPDIATVASKR